MVETLEILGGEDCIDTAKVELIKKAKKSISRMSNVNYPFTLSPEDDLAVKTKICVGYVRKIFLRIVEKCQSVTMAILSILFYREGVTIVDWHINLAI